MITISLDDFVSVLEARRSHCQSLLDLSRRQIELIERDDFVQLLEILGSKQRLLGRLDEIGRSHPHLRRQWHSLRKTIDPEIRDECEHLMAEIESLLAETMQEERSSTDLLTQHRNRTQEQLRSVSSGSQVHAAYLGNLAPATHRHLNVDH